MTRVLIVDVNPDSLRLLRSLLEGHGCEVEEARHGAEALAKAHRHPPTVVISDLLMPVTDGYTLLRQWKGDERLKSIPFVVYTAMYTKPADQQAARDLGADAFVVKPAEPRTLLTRLREVIAQAGTGLPAGGQGRLEPVALKEHGEAHMHELEAKVVELARLNREMAERQALLRAILDTEPECVKLVASDGSLLEMNPAGLRMIEADSLQQLVSHSLYPLIRKDHRAAFRALTRKVFRGESGTLEFEIVGLKGGHRWLETHATPLRDQTGAITALLGVTRDITARREAEERVRQTEGHLLKAFAVCPIAIGINRLRDRKVIDVNAAFLDLIGCTRDEAIGRTPEELGFAAPIAPPLWASLETHQALSNVELVFTTRRGDTRHLVMGVAMATLRDEKHAIATFFDITDRKIAEETRRRNEERYLRQRDALIALTSAKVDHSRGLSVVLETITECAARTLGVARVSIWRYDQDHATLRCVDLYDLEANGHSNGMELARSSYPAYFKALEQLEVIAADDACADPRTCEFADDYLRPLGITAMVDAPVQVGGAVAGVVCYEHVGARRRWTEDEQVFALAVANVTSLGLEEWERRRAENELRDARTRLERAVAAGNVGLWDWDLATNHVFYSPEWRRQLGYDDHEISNAFDEWQSRLHPDDRDRALLHIQAHLAQPSPPFEFEVRLRHKNGGYRHILVRGSLMRDDAGEPVRLLGSHVDITTYTELQAQFLQAQKMESVGQLAGGVAHDFNNLLTVINGTVDLVLSGVNAADPMRADLLQIRDAGNRAASLTRQLLAFSRKQMMKPQILDLNEVVEGMQSMLQRLIGERIELVVRLAKPLGAVRADPGQMEQIVMNLAVNGRDAMPTGGVLTIETQDVELDAAYASDHPSVTPGPHVMLAVSDVGVGMDETTRARIFEPFFTTKGLSKGTGLGLSTVYGIVKQSGGSVWVYSEPARGTAFKIYLPRVEEAAEPLPARPRSTTIRGTETILVVEDEAAVRSLATRALRSAGYSVLEAGNSAEALSSLEGHKGRVHLMLTDLVMPGMSGRELAEHLASIYPGMKVLYTSGYTDDAILRHGVLATSSRFIGKPYTLAELTTKVREVLDASPD